MTLTKNPLIFPIKVETKPIVQIDKKIKRMNSTLNIPDVFSINIYQLI